MPQTLPNDCRQGKPDKPYPDFPLTAHRNGQWCKKIKGKVYYFGPWSDPQGALQRFKDVQDDLFAGRPPKPTDGLTIHELANLYYDAKKRQAESGELTYRSLLDIERICRVLIDHFGRKREVQTLQPRDFGYLRAKMAERLGPVALGNEIQRVRSVFKYAWDERLIGQPVWFGSQFKRPQKRIIRRSRNEYRRKHGLRMFEADEIRLMLDALAMGDTEKKIKPDRQLRAMVLLGVNCGFGNTDCGMLHITSLDLDNGWINYPRPKTEVDRRCPLWPETVRALADVLSHRKSPKTAETEGLVFATKYSKPWAKDSSDSALASEFSKFMKSVGTYQFRRGFYALRHTFETIASESRDQIAVDAIMGHVDDSMAAHYRERISDDRLRAVVDVVHTWLLGEGGE